MHTISIRGNQNVFPESDSLIYTPLLSYILHYYPIQTVCKRLPYSNNYCT